MINLKKKKENYSLENNVSIVLEAILWLYLQLELKGLHHMQNPLHSHISCYLHLNLIIMKKKRKASHLNTKCTSFFISLQRKLANHSSIAFE